MPTTSPAIPLRWGVTFAYSIMPWGFIIHSSRSAITFPL
jgi:hypothetical protein